MTNEPLLTTAGITSFVAGLIALLVAFNVPLTPDQQTAILALVSVVAPLVVGLLARSRVTPTGSAHDPTLRR